uniref:Uncharacterized protein n=1 Tax=Octopus bimaculoides TaxID=37653 RepID=A0A0L8H941_OCTBM
MNNIRETREDQENQKDQKTFLLKGTAIFPRNTKHIYQKLLRLRTDLSHVIFLAIYFYKICSYTRLTVNNNMHLN